MTRIPQEEAPRLKNFLPYLGSRAAVAALLAFSVKGSTATGTLWFIALCGLSLVYLKSGWFRVDASKPLTPISRDEHGHWAQYQALRWSVALGCLAWWSFETLVPGLHLGASAGFAAFQISILCYFAVQGYYLAFA